MYQNTHTIMFTVNLRQNGEAWKHSYKVRHVYCQQASPDGGGINEDYMSS